jgi:hypothetical protein
MSFNLYGNYVKEDIKGGAGKQIMKREIANQKDRFQQELKASELIPLRMLVLDNLLTDTVVQPYQ